MVSLHDGDAVAGVVRRDGQVAPTAVAPHRRQLDAVLVIGITLLVTAVPLLSHNTAIGATSGIALLGAVAWTRRCKAAAPLAAFSVACFVLGLAGVRYSQVVLGLGLLWYAAVVRLTPWLRGTATWARWGSFRRDVRLLAVGSGLVAALALLGWYLLVRPNVADLVETFVPDRPLGFLIVGGLLFSMVNAAVEEGAYRGVIFHALETSLGPGLAALSLQAAAFGTLHIAGFPRGWLGVGLACIYGLLMGVIRMRAGGLFAPWIAHVFTDVVIAGILIALAA